VAGTAGQGAHGGDAVVDVEREAVHHHVVELDSPACRHVPYNVTVARGVSIPTALQQPWVHVPCTTLNSCTPLQGRSCGT
jgi:hypothetical protein